jgi:hypothetical protein
MSIVYTPTQHQLPRGDRLFERRHKSTLLDPMGYPIEIDGCISLAIDATNSSSTKKNDLTETREIGATHELLKPFFGKSFEMVV